MSCLRLPVSSVTLAASLAFGLLSCGSDDAAPSEPSSGAKRWKSGPSSAVPIPVEGISGAKRLSCTEKACCALLADGGIMCWGGAFSVPLGKSWYVPWRVPGIDNAEDLVPSCAVLPGGKIRCWGREVAENDQTCTEEKVTVDSFQLYSVAKAPVPKRIVMNQIPVVCVLDEQGSPFCWGQERPSAPLIGAVGAKNETSCPTPSSKTYKAGADGTLPLGGVRDIAINDRAVCVVLSSNELVCWGEGGLLFGEPKGSCWVNDGPRRVIVKDVASVSLGGLANYCVAHTDGTVSCWGQDAPVVDPVCLTEADCSGGGAVSRNGCFSLPTRVPGVTDAQAVATGTGFACALRADATVSCWGLNKFGMLGDGTMSENGERKGVVQVKGLSDVIQLSSGGGSPCALRKDGTVYCWGYGGEGRLGNGVPLE